MVTILLPSILSRVTGEKKVFLLAKTLEEAIDKLIELYGVSLKEMMFEESGSLNRFLNFYIGGKVIPPVDFARTLLKQDDEVAILIIIGGG
jgi:molybdopterin converting factor small subunit